MTAIGPFIIAIPIVGVLVLLFFFLLALFQGLLIFLTTLWLYPLFIGLAIVVGIILRIRTKSKAISALALWGILILGCTCSTFYYINGNVKFPTMYSADYVLAMPDGSKPSLYEKRHQKGNILAELSIDERVTVNGISMNYKEYNITTESGLTGWVVNDAFPKNAREMLGTSIDLGGHKSGQIQTDRFTERLMEKYMDKSPRSTALKTGEVLEWKYSVSQNTINRSIRVNTQTPHLFLNSDDYKKGETLQDSGEKVTFAHILYADDATIIYLTAPKIRTNNVNISLSGAEGNTNAWKNGLIVTDLVTGDVYRALQADYTKTLGTSNENLESILFFFPPFKSRHFSLTYEVEPMPDPDKIKAGYSGLLGLAYNFITNFSLSTSGGVMYSAWNFPEIRVR